MQANLKSRTEVHYLAYLLNEDEAEKTGLRFEISGDSVVVSETFHFPEYEAFSRPRHMSRKEARALWAKLVASGDYEHIASKTVRA